MPNCIQNNSKENDSNSLKISEYEELRRANIQRNNDALNTFGKLLLTSLHCCSYMWRRPCAVNIFSSAIKPSHNKPTGRQAGRPPGAKNKSKSLSINSVIDQAAPVEHKNDNQDKAIPEVDANATGFYTDLDVRYLFILQAYTYTAFRNYLQLCKTD